MSGLLDTMNLSQGVETQVKQSRQIENTDCLSLNQGISGAQHAATGYSMVPPEARDLPLSEPRLRRPLDHLFLSCVIYSLFVYIEIDTSDAIDCPNSLCVIGYCFVNK